MDEAFKNGVPMDNHEWLEGIDAAITVCNLDGVIIYMNRKSIDSFSAEGGAALIGKSLYDCHPEPAKSRLRELMALQTENIYTIEKKGIKKLIYQTPWHDENGFAGLAEFSFEIPGEMPHFLR